jgi:hypothetical protein
MPAPSAKGVVIDMLLWHQPIRPPRELATEQVFAQLWHERMRRKRDGEKPFASIIHDYTCRDTRIVASIVTWFGTNCGNSFLLEARRLKDKAVPWAYLAQWAINNRRQSSINSGVRLLEHICADRIDDSITIAQRVYFECELTVADYEVADSFMVWLSCTDAQQFISDCECEIEARRLKLSDESRRLLRLRGTS